MFKERGYIDELVYYIKNNLKKGYTKESLKFALLNQGNSRTDVIRAFKKVDKELAEEAPEFKTKPIIKYEIVEPKKYKIKIVKKDSFFKRLLQMLGFR